MPKKLCPDVPLFQAKADESKCEEIYGSQKGINEQQAATGIEMETFDGRPQEYHDCLNLFREGVEKWIQDPKERLLRLLKYTKGEAHDVIKNCLQEQSYGTHK